VRRPGGGRHRGGPVLAVAFAALAYLGRNGDLTGPLYHLTGLAWVAFLLTAAVLVVLSLHLLVSRRRSRQRQREAR
jgi:hypothetical protein